MNIHVGACLAVGAFGALALAVPANATSAAGIAQVCGRTLGLQPGEAHFVACTESLTQSAQDIRRGQMLAWARQRCLADGDPRLAVCELRRADEAPPVPATVLTASGPPPRSYFLVSNAEVVRRIQEACAEVGLDPVQPAFGSCQAGLQAALFEADNPAH